MSERWELRFVLPNLVLPDVEEARNRQSRSELTLAQSNIAIVCNSDPRVLAIKSASKAAAALLEGFSDESGGEVAVAALIVKEEASSTLSLRSVVDFRNAVAAASVLGGRAAAICDYGLRFPTYSDTFDFHPGGLARDGSLYAEAPGRVDLWMRPERFKGSPSPHLFPGGKTGLWWDEYLGDTLGSIWRREHLEAPSGRYARLLFRSLEVAYTAAATPTKNQGSLNDHGATCATWVTALELLARPIEGDVQQDHVLNLLGRYRWHSSPPSAAEYPMRTKSGDSDHRRLNLVQRLANLLYQARHAFTHGDELTQETLRPVVKEDSVPLPRAAALVYWTALRSYLLAEYPDREAAFWDEGTVTTALERLAGIGVD